MPVQEPCVASALLRAATSPDVQHSSSLPLGCLVEVGLGGGPVRMTGDQADAVHSARQQDFEKRGEEFRAWECTDPESEEEEQICFNPEADIDLRTPSLCYGEDLSDEAFSQHYQAGAATWLAELISSGQGQEPDAQTQIGSSPEQRRSRLCSTRRPESSEAALRARIS
jgi:hypothetical protein